MKLLVALALAIASRAETYPFKPKEFYNTFSADHKRALQIKPGDHAVTYAIDAGGVDSKGVQRRRGPNPQTGPFYIEGAEPGDTLVVHLWRLETNRTTGYSASLLAPLHGGPRLSARRGSARRQTRDLADQ
jgi:acetamidase/formamidase